MTREEIHRKMIVVQKELVELVEMLDKCNELDTRPIWREVYKAQRAVTEASGVMWKQIGEQ